VKIWAKSDPRGGTINAKTLGKKKKNMKAGRQGYA
jgi:hypothetical protein